MDDPSSLEGEKLHTECLLQQTRMQPSKMRAARSLTVSHSIRCGEGGLPTPRMQTPLNSDPLGDPLDADPPLDADRPLP